MLRVVLLLLLARQQRPFWAFSVRDDQSGVDVGTVPEDCHALAVHGQAGVTPGCRVRRVTGHRPGRGHHQRGLGVRDDLHVRREPVVTRGHADRAVADRDKGAVHSRSAALAGVRAGSRASNGPSRWITRHTVAGETPDSGVSCFNRRGSDHPLLGTLTVIKPYDTKAQKNGFKFIASLVIPDVESWKKVVSGEANGWDYLGIATDLPFAKVLKLVPDSVVKQGKGAVEDWLRKFTRPDRPDLPSCKCFLAGTEVLMADGETKKIEKIEVGDEVVATDPETGETGLRKVTRLIVTEDDKHFNELTIETPDGREQLTATHEHPFWVPEIGAWVEARILAAGMTLRTPDGTTVRVLSNRAYTKHARTYNLTVDDLHTYYVLAGATPVLVHNSNCAILSASEAAFKAAENPADIFVKNKHLSSFEGRYAKFNTADVSEAQSWIAEGLRSRGASFKPNGLDGTFKMEVDMGRTVGTKGQTGIRIIVANDGRVINAFPFNVG